MGISVLYFCLWEADTNNDLIRDVDNGSNGDLNHFALLMIALFQLPSIPSHEQCGYMMAIWELPWTHSLALIHHIFERLQHLLRLTSLSERILEYQIKLALILGVALHIDAEENGRLARHILKRLFSGVCHGADGLHWIFFFLFLLLFGIFDWL